MTEQEWDDCTEPRKMLVFLRRKASRRRLRLLAAACCRTIWHLLSDGRSRVAVEVSESFADGEVGPAELDRARTAARKATQTSRQPSVERYVGRAVLDAVARDPCYLWWALADVMAAVGRSAAWHQYRPGQGQPFDRTAWERQKGPLCHLIRDLFRPFRPVSLDPAWLSWNGGAIRHLARVAYDDRELPSGHLDAARLAGLADMLEEAGCASAPLLGHLRGPGPHVRGCHVLDAFLGKS